MAEYRIDILGELARQMEFTPYEARRAQVSAAEALLQALDPSKAYPREFVIFRITGYRPRSVGEDLLTGLALQHDLGLLIEQVSDTLSIRTDSIAEPVLDIDDVSERFNVTSKTVQRWRRRGLPARRFIFPDGKRRVGFLLSSVERFFASHQDQVVRGMNFSQVDEAERDEILRRANRLAVQCRCCEGEICRRIARKLNRSPATVLHIIRKHDQEHAERAIFPSSTDALSEPERVRVLKGFRRGLSLKTLSRRTCRTRSSIYRVVMNDRLSRLNRRKVKFIDDPLYHEPGAAGTIADIVAQRDLLAEARPEDGRLPRDLPPYLQALYRTPLLSPARERALFLALNFHKFQFVSARRRVDEQSMRARDLNVLERRLRRATDVKNQIVTANLRLVVSVARKHLRPDLSLMELISEGNLTLMRAVDTFDIHRGFRFSTYATLALMKGFARSVSEMRAKRASGEIAGVLAAIPDPNPFASQRMVDREQVQNLLSRLDPRERNILRSHYGLAHEGPDATSAAVDAAPASYDELGARLGLSRQRVRQIERSALAKLRRSAESD